MNLGFTETKIPNPSPTFLTFGKGETSTISDEDEPNYTEPETNRSKGKKGNNSPWQRMKWSDSRVRLLIHAVACVGDDDIETNRKCLQKKGKWKTVSKIMVSKGCMVSPQQCEDKFNDLNKRYKRLNEILGKGVSCRVVEDPSLLETMPRLSVKMKEDVKKILSSKHLFYPEMCAYHNGQKIPNCAEFEILQENDQENHSDDNNEENYDNDGSDDGLDDGSDDGNLVTSYGSFVDEMNEIFDNSNATKEEKKEWVKKRMLQLVEQRVGIESEGFEMEKRRFKWQRFCDRKDRELEVSRLENERMMLENERMVLQLKCTRRVDESD